MHEIIIFCELLFMYTVEPSNSGCIGNFDDVPYSEVEP